MRSYCFVAEVTFRLSVILKTSNKMVFEMVSQMAFVPTYVLKKIYIYIYIYVVKTKSNRNLHKYRIRMNWYNII